jgi:hypothetical protein
MAGDTEPVLLRALTSVLAVGLVATACAAHDASERPYSAQTAAIGESLALLGWNIGVAHLRWEGDYVLVDVDAAPSRSSGAHAKPEDLRLGLYGALAHPIEANALGGCTGVTGLDLQPLIAPTPQRLTGTACLGPLRDRTQVRGVYVYSPKERIPDTVAAYPAAFPVGVLPTNENDTGLVMRTSGVEAFRADGTPITQADLGDPGAFTGSGYMVITLQIDGLATRYRDDSAHRGGPMMVLAAPSLPGDGRNQTCARDGASVLVLPEASLGAVHLRPSLCTGGEINAAVLYATVSVVGTHAGLWTIRG